MLASMIELVFAWLAAVFLQLAIVIVLVRTYLRTRNVGFVWLGVAVVIWPLVAGLLAWGRGLLVRRYAQGLVLGFYPFSLVERGRMTIGDLFVWLNMLQSLIGACLLFVAVLYLSKTNSTNPQTAAPTFSN